MYEYRFRNNKFETFIKAESRSEAIRILGKQTGEDADTIRDKYNIKTLGVTRLRTIADRRIIRAFERCNSYDGFICNDCPYNDMDKSQCVQALNNDVLALLRELTKKG